MSHFFAYMARMKLIQRWPLMHNLRQENIQEHSLQVAMVAHGLALIGNQFFDKSYPADRIVTLAIFHDASEVLTGDLPSPIKYYNPNITQAYKAIEHEAQQRLLAMLPSQLHSDYRPILFDDEIEPAVKALLKSADILCAYIKCLEEIQHGNHEFFEAKKRLELELTADEKPEVQHFIKLYLPSFNLSLDELNQGF